MSISLEWTSAYDNLIVDGFKAGAVTGLPTGNLDNYIETGLAHVFFFGDTVLKLYKTHHELDHFIKGVLAPTVRRQQFVQHDFTANKHFSQGVYRELHSVYVRDGLVHVVPYDQRSMHSVIVMDKLDFSNNLHEQLISGSVAEESLYVLGRETARLLSENSTVVPDNVTWYHLAVERIVFLRQFIAWLPEKYSASTVIADSLEALELHLQAYRDEYTAIRGSDLVANLDNHDENIFLTEDTIQVIDAIPPMDCWWYGVPESNLTTLVVNVETMLTPGHANHIKKGFIDFFGTDTLRQNIYEFSRAFDYLISIAHYGSLEDKQDIAAKYVAGCVDLPERLVD